MRYVTHIFEVQDSMDVVGWIQYSHQKYIRQEQKTWFSIFFYYRTQEIVKNIHRVFKAPNGVLHFFCTSWFSCILC